MMFNHSFVTDEEFEIEMIALLMYMEQLMAFKYINEKNGISKSKNADLGIGTSIAILPINFISLYESKNLIRITNEKYIKNNKHSGECVGETGPCLLCVYNEYKNRVEKMYESFKDGAKSKADKKVK